MHLPVDAIAVQGEGAAARGFQHRLRLATPQLCPTYPHLHACAEACIVRCTRPCLLSNLGVCWCRLECPAPYGNKARVHCLLRRRRNQESTEVFGSRENRHTRSQDSRGHVMAQRAVNGCTHAVPAIRDFQLHLFHPCCMTEHYPCSAATLLLHHKDHQWQDSDQPPLTSSSGSRQHIPEGAAELAGVISDGRNRHMTAVLP